jgi:hypothetical protein
VATSQGGLGPAMLAQTHQAPRSQTQKGNNMCLVCDISIHIYIYVYIFN